MPDNELALVGGEINASTVSEALTAQLEDALLGASDAKEAAREIAKTPALLAEARDKLALVSRLARPLTPNEVYVALQPLVIMFGPPDFGQDEVAEEMQGAWFDICAKALKEHPREALDIAVSEWLRIGKPFFPKPTELNKLAEETSAEIKLIAFRLRMAVERADQHRPTPKRTPEDAAGIRAMVLEMKGADGRLHLAPKSTTSVTPPTNRQATAAALRRLADYR